MNILFINNIPFNPFYGGIERVTDSIVRVLVSRGYIIYYLCGKVYDKRMLDYDFPVSIVTMPDDGLFSSKKNVEFYISFIKDKSIDIIVNQRGLENDFNRSLIQISGVKYISVIHSMPLAYMYSAIYSCKLPAQNLKEKLKNIIKICFKHFYEDQKIRIHKVLQKNHYAELISKSNLVVLLSENFINDFKFLDIDIPQEKLISIPNPNSFPKQKKDFAGKRNAIMFSGRLSPEKNPMALLKAWERIYRRLPTWELWFVGDGDYYNNVSEYIKKNNLERVTLCGRRSNMIDYYHQAKIVCLTSYYEGWGMALTEGMQCGCVPVAFDSYAAASDIIEDGVNGILVTPFKIKELSESLCRLANDNALFERYSKAAYEKTFQYDISVVADKWEQALLSI